MARGRVDRLAAAAKNHGKPAADRRHNDQVIEIRSSRPDDPRAAETLRAYMTDIVGRYHGRPTTTEEIDDLLREYPNDDLAPPAGAFLLAWDGEEILGCVGVRVLEPGTTEITRMFVHQNARRRGVASRLLAAAEDAGRALGATRMRLDTRKDLVEARALYPRHGYVEIPDYNGEFYADHWFEKQLSA